MTALVFNADTSVAEKAFIQVIKVNGRNLREQVITSIGWICVNAQKMTPFASISRIDEGYGVLVNPITATGRPSKAKKPRHFSVTTKKGQVPMAALIIMARSKPGSYYNEITGNRWALTRPERGSGEFREWIKAAISRMTLAAHSSTHFLQHGWAPAIKAAFNDPDFKHSKQYRSANAAMGDSINRLNTIDSSNLGGMTIDLTGDDFVVTAENNVGENMGGSNDVLARKHREALIFYGSIAAQKAIDMESTRCAEEFERRTTNALEPINRLLN